MCVCVRARVHVSVGACARVSLQTQPSRKPPAPWLQVQTLADEPSAREAGGARSAVRPRGGRGACGQAPAPTPHTCACRRRPSDLTLCSASPGPSALLRALCERSPRPPRGSGQATRGQVSRAGVGRSVHPSSQVPAGAAVCFTRWSVEAADVSHGDRSPDRTLTRLEYRGAWGPPPGWRLTLGLCSARDLGVVRSGLELGYSSCSRFSPPCALPPARPLCLSKTTEILKIS